MKLSVIMPVFNEAKTLPIILKKVLNVPLVKEVIVVDDGSIDETPRILEKFREHNDIKLIRHEFNQGKGMAVRSALDQICGEIVIIQDADLEYDPEDYPKLISPIADGRYRVIYLTRRGPYHLYLSYYWGARMLTMLTNIMYRQKLTDMTTCYKVFDATVLKSISLESKGFAFDPEVTAKVARQGIVIGEVPVSYQPRTFAEGKKIRWVDGVMAFWTLVKYRFTD